MITSTGFFIGGLCALALYKKEVLYVALVISALLQASSVINIGSIGVPSFAFVQIVIAIYFFIGLFSKRGVYKCSQKAANIIYMLFVFFVCSVIISLVSPVLFSGIPVLDPKVGIDDQYQHPQGSLFFSLSNLAQIIYFFLNIVTVLFLIDLVRSSDNSSFFINVFFVSIPLAIVLDIYQYVVFFTGEETNLIENFFFNNPSYNISNHQFFSITPRFSASFLEPSMAGLFFSSLASALFIILMTLKPSEDFFKYMILFILSIFLLILTTSSVGYVSFLITAFIFSILFLFKGWRIDSIRLFFLVAIIFVLLIILVFYYDIIYSVLEFVLLNKADSSSFIHRSFSNDFSVEIFYNTYFLGAGLGSSRPSSFFYYLLSNVGILSFILFFAFFLVIFYAFRFLFSFSILFFLCFFVSVLINMLIAVPDLSLSFLWISFGLLIGFLEREVNYVSG